MASTTVMSPAPQQTKPDGTAGTLLFGYLADQFSSLKKEAPRVRKDLPESVHQMRQATRRLRSVLAAARKLFDDDAVAHLRGELKWLAGALGKARDAQVIHERLTELVASEPHNLVLGNTRQRLDDWFRDTYADGHRQAVEALDGGRYSGLLEELKSFLASPPLTDKATRPARKSSKKLLAKENGRLRDRVDEYTRIRDKTNKDAAAKDSTPGTAALQDPLGDHRASDAALHEIRKAAKRVRYAAEAAEPTAGERAARLAKSAHKLQQVLGVHQDSVVARELLLELDLESSHSGESGFSFGRLHAREETVAADAEAGFLKAWKKYRTKVG